MQKFLLISSVLICLIYSGNVENIVLDDITPADSYSLKQFEKSAEEFSEQFTLEVFDPDEILGSGYEFLENAFPASLPQVPSLTGNHTTNTSLLLDDHAKQENFCQKTDRVTPEIYDYSLNLPLFFYHPPRI